MGQSSLSTSCTRTGCSQLPCQPWPGVWLSLSSLLSALSWQNPNLCSGEEENMEDMGDMVMVVMEATEDMEVMGDIEATMVDTMAKDLLNLQLQLIQMLMLTMEAMATEGMEDTMEDTVAMVVMAMVDVSMVDFDPSVARVLDGLEIKTMQKS